MAVSFQESPANVTSLDSVRQQRLDVQLRQMELHATLHRKLELDALLECLMAEGQAFVPFDGLSFRATERGCDHVLGDVRQHRQHFELKLGERSLGEIVLMRGRAFDAREERAAERLVESLVYPLDNALVHYEALLAAMTDGTTGLLNQDSLARQLPHETRRSRRLGQPLALMLIGVDYLESISEHHGTEVGKQAWRAVAQTLTGTLRHSDLVFRIDSDAFCVLLPDTGLDAALQLGHRLREMVDRCVSADNVQFVLTASGGVAELVEGEGGGELLHRARDALSRARQGGRNRLLAADAPPGGPGGPGDGDAPDAA